MEWFYQAMPVRLSAGASAVGACEEQRRQGDTALRYGEALYRSIVSTSPDGFWVLGIVRGHGGAIFVDSELDRGTTVKVLFPVAAPA